MGNKEDVFYGIVTDIGDLIKGKKSNFYPVTMADGQGEELKFLLFDNQEDDLQKVNESLENSMTLEITYVENRVGSKIYTNPIKDGIIWADDADAVDSDDVESEGKKTKGKEAQSHIAQRKGKEAFEPAINKEKQESIQTQVALKEVGEMLRSGGITSEDVEEGLEGITGAELKLLLSAYWLWLRQHLIPKPDLVKKAEEILGAEVTSSQKLTKPTKTQITAIQRLLAEQVSGKPEDIDMNAAAIARFEKGHKVTGDEARDWIHELQASHGGSPEDIAPEELPF